SSDGGRSTESTGDNSNMCQVPTSSASTPPRSNTNSHGPRGRLSVDTASSTAAADAATVSQDDEATSRDTLSTSTKSAPDLSSRSTSSERQRRQRVKSPPKSSDVVSLNELAYAELSEMQSFHSTKNNNNNKLPPPPSQQPLSARSTSTPTNNSPPRVPKQPDQHSFFPMACRSLLYEIDGNNKCLDCGTGTPEWAIVHYGGLVCIQCSGSHRSLGVQTSTVRHVTMDHWTYPQVIKMLEGGNQQLSQFFERHCLSKKEFIKQQQQRQQQSNGCAATATAPSESSTSSSSVLTPDNIAVMRYKTKAALFYRQQLDHHVQHLLQNGKPYRGRKDRKVKRRPLGTQASSVG
ncbi:MAG: hypothetical protein SGILL_006820, partial [Bacillariaceae sp.]